MGDELTPLTFGSLFAGIGGFDLGLEAAGMVCKWQVEKDPFCLKVLAKHWPNVTRIGDIYNVGKHNLPTVDLICGGFPCQPFSNAGKRQGSTDDRYLWPEMLRVIRELKPRWVIGENVAGFISMELDNALIDLEAEGYQVEPPFVIPACAVDAPHRRNRIWIVAHADPIGRNGWPWQFGPSGGTQSKDGGFAMANSNGKRKLQPAGRISQERGRSGNSSEFVENAKCHDSRPQVISEEVDGPDAARPAGWPGRSSRWPAEPELGRVANGIPHRVDRLRGLGNAVVPQIVEIIGRAIIEIDKSE